MQTTATGLAFDATTRDWTQPVTYVARNRQEALNWMTFNADWFRDLHIVETVTPVTVADKRAALGGGRGRPVPVLAGRKGE